MRKLSLTLLAASTMLIAGVATAQPAPGARPGATWRGGGNVQMRGPNVQMRAPNVQMRAPNVQMRGPHMRGQVRTGGGFQAGGHVRGGHVRGGNFNFHRWGRHPGRNWRYERLRRGGFINSFWFAPQFYVGNWQAYGFAAPGQDQRWVRYYDDAYLVDGHGRILGERYGVNWNGYGEEWEDHDGIPGYRGAWRDSDEGYEADEEGYAYEEHGESRGGHGGYAYGPPPPGYGPPPPPGYGPPPGGPGGTTHVYGGGYGYGHYAYPIVIETVTTTGSTGYVEEITEEYVEVRQARRRATRPRRARCACAPAPRPAVRRPAPRPAPPRRPPPGERG
ncbi:MAG TPA: RcnB family protein [Allosphingosinicella sp.]|nr:RcnB family protein [Allosphingosinicella sp.]